MTYECDGDDLRFEYVYHPPQGATLTDPACGAEFEIDTTTVRLYWREFPIKPTEIDKDLMRVLLDAAEKHQRELEEKPD